METKSSRPAGVTQPLPRGWFPAVTRPTNPLPVHMPVALDLEFAAAVTQRLTVLK